MIPGSGMSMAHLDGATIAAAQANPDVGYLVDAPYANAPLVISFSYIAWDELPHFDFVGRTSKLEATTGRNINRIFVRDPANFWYLHGVPGLGRDVDSVAVALREFIAEIMPTSVSTLGQSMGGYAAVLFGALLDVDQVLAFGPLSYFRSDWAHRDGDLRWVAVMEKLDRFPPAQRHDDLPAMLSALPRLPAIHLIYGTGPELGQTNPNRDSLHATRFRAVPGVHVYETPQAGHDIVSWLVAKKQIDKLLERGILPVARSVAKAAQSAGTAPPTEQKFRGFDDGWRSWVCENLALGADRDKLLGDLGSFGFHPGEAECEINKAERSPYAKSTRRLAQRVTRREWTLDSQAKLRRLSADTEVPRRHRLDRASFLRDFYSANRPVVITGMIEDWPMRSWSPGTFDEHFAERMVQVQTGRTANPAYERQAGRHEEMMRFHDFMARVGNGHESNDIYMTARNSPANRAELAGLWENIVQIPEYLETMPGQKGGLFWIGPAGTVTPTHHDLTNNLLAQVVGRKRVHLVDAMHGARIYNHQHVFSDVDLEAIDYARHPLMRDVDVQSLELQPGELLFVPVGWWHHVRALDFSVTVTFTNFVFSNDFYKSYRNFDGR